VLSPDDSSMPGRDVGTQGGGLQRGIGSVGRGWARPTLALGRLRDGQLQPVPLVIEASRLLAAVRSRL
jgi:hypothetical protein